jgi:hypothetical protein
MRPPPNGPIALDPNEVEDLAQGGYLPYTHPADLQPALRTKNENGDTLLHKLTQKGICLSKYPPGTLTAKDLLQKNKNGTRPIDLAINQSRSHEEAIQKLHIAIQALPQNDAEKLVREVKKNGLGKFQMQSAPKQTQKTQIEIGLEQ